MKDFFKTVDKIDRSKLLCGDQTPSQIESSILKLAWTMGESSFRDQAAGILAEIVNRSGIIPDAYHSYRCVVQDGVLFFISMLSVKRLAGLLAQQACLNEHTDAGQRLLELAKQIPTFHKLGQMIARNRHIDPGVCQWLVQLENGAYGTDVGDLCHMIQEELGSEQERFSIQMGKELLSEASVGAVLPFSWREPESDIEKAGVFKVLKPMVETRLQEELAALDALADYFVNRREFYPLGDFRFRELFGDVKTALLEELDLFGEQENLFRASRFYRKNKEIRIPKVAPFSSRNFTVMSRIDGGKVTDVLVSPGDRKYAADAIFRAVVCAPLFSPEEFPIFHGDPHAGNIFATERCGDGDFKIALLDWSQAGRLARRWRVEILKFVQGILLDDDTVILRAAEALSSDPSGEGRNEKISGSVGRILALGEYRNAPLMKKVFIMLEQLSFEGIRFHKDLLLFRKAFFTMDGLIYDLDPEFSMDQAMMIYIRDLLIGELPRRIAAFLIPISDAPEKYRTLLSNKDLQMLLICHAMEFVKKNVHKVMDFMENHAGLFESLFHLPKVFSSRTAKVLLGLYFLYRMRNVSLDTKEKNRKIKYCEVV